MSEWYRPTADMDNFRLFMWMLFVIALLALAMCAFGNADTRAVGGGVLTGVGALAFFGGLVKACE